MMDAREAAFKEAIEVLRDQMRVWGNEKKAWGNGLGTEMGRKMGNAAGFAWQSAANELQKQLDIHYGYAELANYDPYDNNYYIGLDKPTF